MDYGPERQTTRARDSYRRRSGSGDGAEGPQPGQKACGVPVLAGTTLRVESPACRAGPATAIPEGDLDRLDACGPRSAGRPRCERENVIYGNRPRAGGKYCLT